MRFPAFRIDRRGSDVHGQFVEAALDELTPGDVRIRGVFSSVNYKDALAATGRGKILRRFPLIGGIDVAGIVEHSTDPRFAPGDEVLVTGYDLGVTHDGGYASYVRVPAAWVVPLPSGLTLFEAMALGTAGFTAGLALLRLERNGLQPGQGPVVVTGATGGVGSLAIACLAARGYEITAMTGKEAEADYLRSLGAREILPRHQVVPDARPLESAVWAAAVDTVGGETLAWLTRTTNYWGGIASTGLAGGHELHTTVMPFILRGVSLLGIDSAHTPMPLRLEVWRRLSTDLKPPLDRIARTIEFGEITEAFETLLAGEARGRLVVRLP